jgi:hypothetical protein
MNKFQMVPATGLMTIEEAKHLSTLEGCEIRREERQRARVWSWQSIESAMSQSISDEQIDALAERARR